MQQVLKYQCVLYTRILLQEFSQPKLGVRGTHK